MRTHHISWPMVARGVATLRRETALLLSLSAAACAAKGPEAASPFPAEALLSGIESRSGTYRFDLFTSPEQPPVRGTISLKLVATLTGGAEPATGLSFDIVPNMPSMGHGTPVTPTAHEQAAGDYLVTDVNLFMPGRWDLNTSIRPSSSPEDHVTFSLDVR